MCFDCGSLQSETKLLFHFVLTDNLLCLWNAVLHPEGYLDD